MHISFRHASSLVAACCIAARCTASLEPCTSPNACERAAPSLVGPLASCVCETEQWALSEDPDRREQSASTFFTPMLQDISVLKLAEVHFG